MTENAKPGASRRRGRPASGPEAADGHGPSGGPERRAALFDVAITNSPVGLALVDRDFRYEAINEVLARGHGASVADHLGRTVADVAPRAWSNLRPVYERVLAGETVHNLDVPGHHVSETEVDRSWLVSYYPVRLGEEIIGIGIVANDVTDLTELRRALGDRTRLYAMLAHTNRAVIQSASAAELFAEVCRIAVEDGGFALAWIGVPHDGEVDVVTAHGEVGYLDALHISLAPEDPDSRGPTGRAFATGTPQVLNDFLAADMTAPWHRRAAEAGFRSSASLPIRERGEVVAALGLYSTSVDYFTPDLIETLSEIAPILSYALDHFADERLRQADEVQLRTHDRALSAISQGVLITEATGDMPIIYASPSFCELTGYDESEVLGRNCRFLQGPETAPDAVNEIRRAIAEERECTVELVNYCKDGSSFWNRLTIAPVLDDAGRVTNFVGVQTDMTASRELERQLLQAQKLEALGTLAGGIAHDFNNMLLVIRGYSGLLAQELEEGPLRDMAERIDAAVQRAAEFTRRLLTFSRGQMVNPRSTDLSTVVSDTLRLLERVIGEDIALVARLATDLPPVVVDPTQIEQAVLNLVTNARDAMPDGGTIEVRTSLVTLDGEYAERYPEVTPGPHVALEIADSGVGMDAATQARVFEPFFTTKESGTGLGLSTVYGIVRRCGGHVRLVTAPGAGTTFSIFFPVAPVGAAPHEHQVTELTSLAGTETVLVVEDVDEARDLVSRYLAGLGYVVVVAANGRDALGVAHALERPIDVLVTDIVMPQMNGRDLARQLLEARPDLAIVFTSGLPTADVAREAPFAGRATFLEKPYSLDQVARAVRDVLDEVHPRGD